MTNYMLHVTHVTCLGYYDYDLKSESYKKCIKKDLELHSFLSYHTAVSLLFVFLSENFCL